MTIADKVNTNEEKLTINLLKTYKMIPDLSKNIDIILITKFDMFREIKLSLKRSIYNLDQSINILNSDFELYESLNITGNYRSYLKCLLKFNKILENKNCNLNYIFNIEPVIEDFNNFNITKFINKFVMKLADIINYYKELYKSIEEYEKLSFSDRQKLKNYENIIESYAVISYLWMDILFRYEGFILILKDKFNSENKAL